MQSSPLFARAILADAVCDAHVAGLTDAWEVLEAECDYLVEERVRVDSGGWSYFPELPELPCDTDVLAAVAQVLIRCGRSADVEAFVTPPLDVLLRDGRRDDGSLGTWILPKEGLRSPRERRQARFVETAWGDTSDPEVTANILYALILLDPGRHAAAIERAGDYLRRAQEPDGSWRSTWYAGPFYGTYVASRFLRTRGRGEELERARAFLHRSARSEGGWETRAFDQLATSLALCALAAARDEGAPGRDDELAQRAFARLHASVLAHGWKGARFIVMDVGRADGHEGPILSYGSAAVTAAYGLKAVAAWSGGIGGESAADVRLRHARQRRSDELTHA